MNALTDEGHRRLSDIAFRYGLSLPAVETMARAVLQGGGSMAQFDIPELGGSGQWMAGGMTMVGDMFNQGLQAQVANLCGELSDLLSHTAVFAAPPPGVGGAWWPHSLGAPASVGGQNQLKYAYFPQMNRLALDMGDGAPPRLYDTLNHSIGGFSQQQSGVGGDPASGLTFSSQFGQYAVTSLPFAPEYAAAAPAPEPAPTFVPAPPPPPAAEASPAAEHAVGAPLPTDAATIIDLIEKLAALRDAGALSDDEFAAKKTELLARL